MDHSEIPITPPHSKNFSQPELVSIGHTRLPLLAWVGILLLALFIFITNILLLTDAHRRLRNHKGEDHISLYENRFAQLRQVLKSGTVMGYFTDQAPESRDYVKNFYLTQYALAPVIIIQETQRQWVVGNFSKSTATPAVAPHKSLYLWKDFGNGIALFQHKNK
jgi:hypothetical protein